MEQPTADGEGARSGRTPTRPARAARLSSLRSRVTAGVAVAAFALAVITALVIGRAAFAVRDLERSQYAGMATETRFRLERLASRDRTRLMDVAFSDALYQLVNRGAAPPDSFIRPPFVERF